MAHRGRLNVLSQVMGKPHRVIFHEFKGGSASPDEVEGSGDVKYHLGASSDREFDRKSVHLSLTANPSHLEIVDPVVLGKVRAKQDQLNDYIERTKVVALLIHGDAAFAGQGVVAECFGLYRGGGGRVGGTPDRQRSHLQSRYPSLAARMDQSQLWLVQPHAEPGEETPGFLHREGQVCIPELDQVLMGPHPMHPQRRVNPAGHHQLQRRRVILHQPPQGVGAGRPGQVKIINDQDPQPIWRLKVVSQSRHHINRHLAIKAHQLAGILTEPWLAKAIPGRLDDGRDEPGRVGVGRVAAQPRRWPLRAGGQPVGNHHGLARPRRAHHQGEPSLFASVQLVEQA